MTVLRKLRQNDPRRIQPVMESHGTQEINLKNNRSPRSPNIVLTPIILTIVVWWVLLPSLGSSQEVSPVVIPEKIQTIMATRCLDCHEGDSAEGGVRFDNFASLKLAAKLDLLNRSQDQIFFGLMPPVDAEQPDRAERDLLAGWLRRELRSRKASTLDEKLRQPSFGNYVDHEQLFNGSITDKAFTPARRWLVSPQIFHERVNAVFKLAGNARQRSFYGVTNPIVLPEHSGVHYYDTTALDGGHLLVMLNNAQWIADKQLLAATHQGADRNSIKFENEKDRWYPPSSPEAFVKIATHLSTPTDEQLTTAIHGQFDCVLQRDATPEELDKYLPLFRSAIELAGNKDGLRQMLVSVLLQSEFLYRQEFGAGEQDAHGRQKLSPREASYAIAYAVSDRVPDEELAQAASAGRLITKDDYHREVTRLLNDKKTFYDEIDPTLNGIHLRSHKVTHPKITRFFREFFGYPASVKLFKDVMRSGGFFDNAARGYTGTAGAVTNEADRIVDYILTQDKDVFEQLLTTDLNFVLHTKSNAQGQKIVDGWRQAYAGLKDTDWADNPEQVLLKNFQQHKDLFALIRITDLEEKHRKNHVRDFGRYMLFFEYTFGKGRTPITFPWFFHGGQKFRYSEIYNLPPLAGAGPLHYQGRWSRGEYGNDETWDYPIVQPFKIPNRKGLLTHPAWLLAHSQNTETDPVRRGRWIQEKLLAGRVPDVPITVDAQIPEDHHRTLRERLDPVTAKQECWKCHQFMNPLGLTFEVFDDFGRYRTRESLEHPDNILQSTTKRNTANVYKTKPVNATGHLSGTGDPSLDGDVTDAFELIDRLVQSKRVRQSIVRHAFRYFMGRNEMLSDSQTLIDADNAYVNSGGSFQAVVVSLLTSDSFMYRKDGF
ncbi:MAG: DUF1588 domain-containing protein [Planctomycetaceae bacterium]|nr:DUF1588 domain-containing protein [Planctomycetaceae bacterium]